MTRKMSTVHPDKPRPVITSNDFYHRQSDRDWVDKLAFSLNKPKKPRRVKIEPLPAPKSEPVSLPVTIGYHTVKVKKGQSVRVNSKGFILIIGSRGKITNTRLNINTPPKEFHNTPLAGDIRNIKYVDTQPYKTDEASLPKNIERLFHLWSGDFISTKKFKKNGTLGSIQLYQLELKYTGATLVAASEHPTYLLYIVRGGIKYYPQAGKINPEVPSTSLYVRDVEKAHRGQLDYLRKEEKEKLNQLELPSAIEDEAKYQTNLARKIARKKARLAKKMAAKEVALTEAKIIITRQEALVVSGILIPSETPIETPPNLSILGGVFRVSKLTGKSARQPQKKSTRVEEEAQDKKINKRILTKIQLAARAKEIYLRLQAEKATK